MGGHTSGINWRLHKVRLAELVARGNTTHEISKILTEELGIPVSYEAVGHAKCRYGVMKHIMTKDEGIKLYNVDTIPDGNYMISCDYHSPSHSEEWINRLLMIADKHEIKEHIIVGDLFDMDFAKSWYDDESTTLDEEVEKVDPVIKALDYFDMNYLVMGNHEKRVGWSTDSKIQARHIFGLFGKEIWEKKFKLTTYDKVKIGEKWLLVHPKSYSQISGSVAVRLAEKYHRHILNSHGHFVALRYDRSGKYMGIDLGGMFDRRKVGYINKTTTTHPVWVN